MWRWIKEKLFPNYVPLSVINEQRERTREIILELQETEKAVVNGDTEWFKTKMESKSKKMDCVCREVGDNAA